MKATSPDRIEHVMYQMTQKECNYWEAFIAAVPAAQSRFIGVKFIKDKKEPDYIPNFNTLFNQFLREYATINGHLLNKKDIEKFFNNKNVVSQAIWFTQCYDECYVNFDDDII